MSESDTSLWGSLVGLLTVVWGFLYRQQSGRVKKLEDGHVSQRECDLTTAPINTTMRDLKKLCEDGFRDTRKDIGELHKRINNDERNRKDA